LTVWKPLKYLDSIITEPGHQDVRLIGFVGDLEEIRAK